MKKTTPSQRRTSWKILIIFWIIAAALLAAWYVFLQVKYRNIENLRPFAKIAPIGGERRDEIGALMDIYGIISGTEEKNLLVLFQNDLELRPGGGFIGAFGVIKFKNGKIQDIAVEDTGNFDQKIPANIAPPAPLAEIIGTKAWKMRDSNWSPDFKVNAEQAEYFYKLGGFASSADKGEKNIDGVIAINTVVLNSLLSITGPVKIDGYPGEYRDENAILQLEYQVEKGYLEQGIAKGERKNIMAELADILAEKAQNFSFSEQLQLARKMEDHLKQKDIQLFFKDKALQDEIEKVGWGGRVKNFDGDYLMVIDANLLARKSDFCIRRRMEYAVDIENDIPQAELAITYEHTCRVKDWMTSDYRSWLRVYAPNGSFLAEADGQNGDVEYSAEFDKKVFGMLVIVPVGETKTIILKYRLPEYVKRGDYRLLVQKQSGSGAVPFDFTLNESNETALDLQETLKGDREFEFSE